MRRASSVVTITTKDTNIIELECAGFLYINSAGRFVVITKSINVTIYGMLILYQVRCECRKGGILRSLPI